MKKSLEHKGYIGTVDYDFDSNCLHGQVLFINDAVIYQGSTPLELRTSFISAVDDYLETCIEVGKLPDKPFSGSFNIRIEPGSHRTLAIKAAQKDTSINALINDAIKVSLDETKEIVSRHVHEHTYLIRYSDLGSKYHAPYSLGGRSQVIPIRAKKNG